MGENDEEKKRLREENKRLAKEIERLKRENEELRKKLSAVMGSPQMLASSDKTAEAGGVPSSKVFYRRSTPDDEKKPTGGQVGHMGHARARPTPNTPPVVVSLDDCPACGGELGAPRRTLTRTVTDIPPPSLLIYEVQTREYSCPHCLANVKGESPLPSHEQYGPNVVAWVVHHRIVGLSIVKIQESLERTFGLRVSEATILRMETQAAEALGEDYEQIKKIIKGSDCLGGDESKFRVHGKNGWLWTFVDTLAVLYEVANTRGGSVPARILEGFDGVLVRDGWKPYDKISCKGHQLDHLHTNRWLERVEVIHGIEPRGLLSHRAAKFTRAGRPPAEFIRFADGIRARLREAILFIEKNAATITLDERKRKSDEYLANMVSFLGEPWKDANAVRIGNELRSRQDMLFTFIRVPNVPWHNNAAERAIRQGVYHRKISGGRQTWPGAARLSTLLSVFETCKKTGENFIDLVLKRLASRGTGADAGAPTGAATGT
ncbi:MAG: IS66 family transposase [Candidatus Thermoplasmatota archaeon]